MNEVRKKSWHAKTKKKKKETTNTEKQRSIIRRTKTSKEEETLARIVQTKGMQRERVTEQREREGSKERRQVTTGI